MNKVYSGYEIELNKEEDKAYKAKILKIEGNSYQETRDEVAGTTVSGDFISISDAQDLPITKFNIEGKSVQETRSGKNMINPNKETVTNLGLTYTYNSDNDTINIKGTSTGANVNIELTSLRPVLKKDIAYTQSIITVSGKQENINIVPSVKKSNGEITYNYFFNNETKTPTEDLTVHAYNAFCPVSGATIDWTFKIQLEESPVATEYERYGKTPSIEYEAPTESVGDNINLLPLNNVEEINKNGLKYSCKNGKLTINGTATALTNIWFNDLDIKMNVGEYTLSSNTNLQGKGSVALKDLNGNIVQTNLSASAKITLDKNTTATQFLIQISSGATFTNFEMEIKLEKGTKATPYSPYGQGSIEIKKTNKNLLDMTNAKGGTSGGITCTVNNNGSYSYVGTATSTAVNVWFLGGYSSSDIMPVLFTLKAGTYYVKDCRLYNKTSNVGGTKDGEIITLTKDTNITGVRAVNAVVGENYNETLYPIIALSNVPVDFIQHQSQTKALYTQQPFRAIGDVKDRFVKKMGKWYEEHFVYEKILDENETIGYSAEQGEYTIFQIHVGTVLGTNVKSSKLPAKHNWGSNFNFESIWTGGTTNSSLQIKILTSRLSEFSTTAIKTWLSENNMTVIYALETPTLIPCTPEQVEVLESMRTYEGVNHIYTTDELEPTISLRYNYIPALPSLDGESKAESVGDNINLLDTSNYIINNLPNVDVKRNNDGAIVINGTTDNYGGDVKIVYENPLILPAGNYSFIFGVNGAEKFNNELNITSLGKGTYQLVKRLTESLERKTIIFDTDFELYNYNIHFKPNTTFKDFVIYPKICKGISTPYSPYGQGSVEIKQENKNFINIKDGSWTENGLAVNVKDNVININGTVNADSNVFFTLKESLNLNSRYSFQAGNNVALTGGEYFRLYTGTTGYEVLKAFGALTSVNVKSENINISGRADRLAIRVGKGTVFNNVIFKPQLEIGSSATTYIQYQGKTQTIYTQQPFRAIGDVKDRFVKVDGVWYEEHSVEEKIYTGNENWEKRNSLGDSYTRFGTTSSYGLNAIGFCDKLKVLSNANWANQEEKVDIDNSSISITVKKDRLDTDDVAGFKNFLLSNNITIYAKLKEPLLIPCTPQQSTILDQLENIQLYDGVNYIYTIDEIQPLLTLEIYNMIEDYDLYVSNDGYFGIPGTDIKFLVNFHESNLPTMPEAVEASVRAAGRDGDYVLNTTYEPLPFEIVCYTEDNLTVTQKREIESKVNRFLNSIKNRTKKIAFEKGEKFYNVKYNGLLTTTNYPAHLKFSIPLKSSESFGKDAYQKVLSGNSTEVSDTVEEVGALITIYGPATLPIIALNDYSMEYDTAILEGARIEIDTAKSTATHINSDGVKTNVMRYYNHQFPKIQPGENTLKVLSGVDDENNVTVKWNDLKL